MKLSIRLAELVFVFFSLVGPPLPFSHLGFVGPEIWY